MTGADGLLAEKANADRTHRDADAEQSSTAPNKVLPQTAHANTPFRDTGSSPCEAAAELWRSAASFSSKGVCNE